MPAVFVLWVHWGSKPPGSRGFHNPAKPPGLLPGERRILVGARERARQSDYIKVGVHYSWCWCYLDNRRLIQRRLKLPGAWWSPETAADMDQLRVTRANHERETFWNETAA